jgi:hypothetical protein
MRKVVQKKVSVMEDQMGVYDRLQMVDVSTQEAVRPGRLKVVCEVY